MKEYKIRVGNIHAIECLPNNLDEIKSFCNAKRAYIQGNDIICIINSSIYRYHFGEMIYKKDDDKFVDYDSKENFNKRYIEVNK